MRTPKSHSHKRDAATISEALHKRPVHVKRWPASAIGWPESDHVTNNAAKFRGLSRDERRAANKKYRRSK
jgi:hypothetical protein